MINNIPLEEDLALKRYSNDSDEKKTHYNWREVVSNDLLEQPENIKVHAKDGVVDFDLAEIAETIGNALTNLLLSREVQAIFTEKNQLFVAEVATAVTTALIEQTSGGAGLTLSAHDVYLLIEKALIEHNAHDVAKSLVFKRSKKMTRHPFSLQVTVVRRNGMEAPWDANKVEIAVRKAFLSLNRNSSPAVDIARSVEEKLKSTGQHRVHIEVIQDLVEEELMRQGHYKVASNYIIYRSHRTHLRVKTSQASEGEIRQDAMIVVKKSDGTTFFWDGHDLRLRIDFATIGLELNMSKDDIEFELRRSIFAEMTVEELKKTIILNSKTLIEKDADFAKFSARILLSYIYEEVLGWDILRDGVGRLKHFHSQAFLKYIGHGVKIERLDKRLLNYDLERLSDALDPMADLDFEYLGIQTLFDRYLIVDKTGDVQRRIETPQIFWMRVAMGLFLEEKKGESKDSLAKEDWVIKLYSMYKGRRFCSSTPTLFNSGTLRSQLSSCYLYKVDDSIESIMHRGIAENAFLSKWAGGLGGSWTSVRGTGSYIKGTNGESQGVIPFLKLHNDQLVAVNQGGKRRGSGCAYLETWHNDIVDFLELRKNTGDDRRRTHDMNTANWIPDLFMKRMEARQDWTLFRSNETPDLHETYGQKFEERYLHYEKQAEEGRILGQKISALDLWKKMLTLLFETGHPWITFKDACNIRNPQDHVGVIHSSNLCTEITLNTSEDETAVCNLGSVVLENHLNDDGSLDHEKLRDTIQVALRALDNVIDINFYPTKAAETSNRRHRPIGLGVMGIQNALYKKDISFASDKAVEFNDEFMEAIAYYAYEASCDLAKERGAYSTFSGSKWDRGLLPQDTLKILEEERGIPIDVPVEGKMDWQPLREKIKSHGMRNSNVLAIAPTATISNIMGSTPCIEPTYKNLFVKSNLSGEFIVLNRYLVNDLKSQGLWDSDMIDQLKYFDGELNNIDNIPVNLKKKFLTAFSIDSTYFIEAAARRQKWIDQSQSVNLFLAQPNLKTLSHMYRDAWRKGLKTTYYLRTLGASNIEKATVSMKSQVRGPMNNNGSTDVIKTADVNGTTESTQYTEAEKQACSIDALINGGTCEACQ